MPAEDLDDDYVAGLLKEEAKAMSQRYKMVGLEAFMPKRNNAKAPKPNTRFLRNILRETDNHNAALLAKEAEEARARLRALKESEGRLTPYQSDGRGSSWSYRQESRQESRLSKRRRLDDSEDDERVEDRKRRHGESRQSRSRREESRDRTRRRDDSRDRTRRRDDSRDRERRKKRRKKDDYSDGEDGHRSRHSHHHHRSRRHRYRSESVDRNARRRDSSRRARIRSSHSRSSSRSRSPREPRTHHKSRRKKDDSTSPKPIQVTTPPSDSPLRKASKIYTTKAKRRRSPSRGSSSDPLEAIIGPAPPLPEPKVQPRGRGAFTASSAMDSHFSSTYDPATDVKYDSDLEDDWDQALEALRDRQRWKQQGADRLRAAGFTDEEVKKWEKGGEKTEQDVKWAKKGEGREWDRGKVVDDDGLVDVKAEWGRLKGT
ncbi:hypothetical protein K432DRAFT_379166 [Lepidopterella palustris CBS 459.81]|uniref:Pre-mRNA-splicing factor 38B n=1 Tax=Lepidopterella palustris CBS 459.81 TaxID=1314670 RepID=A0A8E2JIK4_9PEZI|nr:hypothetical protein K432DRAFT_379166 [Lepidopterella palustris CBS 459.81]